MFPTRHVVQSQQQQQEGGKDVILYSVVTPYGVPVAKATTTSPNDAVAGAHLGAQFYRVVVNHLLVRDALLPRPYGTVKSLADASGRCIAWPCDRVIDDKKSSRQ